MSPEPRPRDAVERRMRPRDRAADLEPEAPPDEEEDPAGATAPPAELPPPDAPPLAPPPPLPLRLRREWWWWDAALDNSTLEISFLLRSRRSVRTEKGTRQILPSSKRNAMCDGPTTHCRTLEFLKLLTTAGGEYPLRNFSPTSLNLQRNKMQHETKKIGSGYPDRKKQFSRRNSVNLNSDEQQENGLPQNRTCNRWLHLMQQPLHYRKTLKVIHHD